MSAFLARGVPLVGHEIAFVVSFTHDSFKAKN
jgi:hypothetical protein